MGVEGRVPNDNETEIYWASVLELEFITHLQPSLPLLPKTLCSSLTPSRANFSLLSTSVTILAMSAQENQIR